MRRRLSAAIGVLVATAVCCKISTAMALSMKSHSTDASRRSTMQRYRSNPIEQVDIDIQQQEQQQHHKHTHIQDQDCNCDRHRRDIILTTLTSAIISLSAGAPTLAAATENDSFEAPMNGLTRQIRTSVVKGAQVIDKLDSKWERFSDDFGLGDKRNQPKRNVIDAGGNERSKKVVQSRSNDGSILLDEVFADNLLKQCDEVSSMSIRCEVHYFIWLDFMLIFSCAISYLCPPPSNNDVDFLDLSENTKYCNNKPRITATTD